MLLGKAVEEGNRPVLHLGPLRLVLLDQAGPDGLVEGLARRALVVLVDGHFGRRVWLPHDDPAARWSTRSTVRAGGRRTAGAPTPGGVDARVGHGLVALRRRRLHDRVDVLDHGTVVTSPLSWWPLITSGVAGCSPSHSPPAAFSVPPSPAIGRSPFPSRPQLRRALLHPGGHGTADPGTRILAPTRSCSASTPASFPCITCGNPSGAPWSRNALSRSTSTSHHGRGPCPATLGT